MGAKASQRKKGHLSLSQNFNTLRTKIFAVVQSCKSMRDNLERQTEEIMCRGRLIDRLSEMAERLMKAQYHILVWNPEGPEYLRLEERYDNFTSTNESLKMTNLDIKTEKVQLDPDFSKWVRLQNSLRNCNSLLNEIYYNIMPQFKTNLNQTYDAYIEQFKIMKLSIPEVSKQSLEVLKFKVWFDKEVSNLHAILDTLHDIHSDFNTVAKNMQCRPSVEVDQIGFF
mmetsp:Transcript_10959/g.21454  ORF Transcript_10959/g.21454 Transcript_10959/m.21454 type:complete len:226 (+) Transcript_10959:696-1373(+)